LKVTSGINDGITNIYIKLNLKNLIWFELNIQLVKLLPYPS
jgi:hypothetical protein